MINRPTKPLLLILLVVVSLSQFFGNTDVTRAQSSQDWSDPVNISNSGKSLDPTVVVTRDGVFHSIWQMATGGFRYSRSDDGITWTPSRQVLFPFVDKELPSLPVIEKTREFPYRLIVGPDGVIHIFWINAKGDLLSVRVNSKLLPVPSSWPGNERIAQSVLNFDVDITSSGEFHIVYIRNDESAGIYYLRSPNGAIWSKAINLYSSQYIASMEYSETHARVVASDDPDSPNVLVGWDVLALKRIFLAQSTDGGFSFSEVRQAKGPEDTGGFGTPFGIELGLTENGTLLLWRVGEPGATQCPIFSQYSTDGGQTWTDPTTVLDIRSLCPEQLNFLITDDDYYMLMLKFKGANPSITVWNGIEWSSPQVQNELSSFTNPLTFEPILFGCKRETLVGTRLYIVGCDEGKGGDVWITSRSLEPLNQWFNSTPSWSYPEVLVLQEGRIANVAQISEEERIHAVWSESSQTDAGITDNSIYYAQFADGQWSVAKEVIEGLLGQPTDLSMTVGQQKNLSIVWADIDSGSLVYTTSNTDRAGLRTEWLDPLGIPTGTNLNASPDILLDASGKIAVAYSVPINEGRGIYVIQATGRDPEWSLPVKVFDAVVAEWERVDNPQIALSSDGKLHILFSRFTGGGEHAIGLYYSQSSDGGATWNPAELIREGSITWTDMVSSDAVTVHRFWQEDRNGVVSNFQQVSPDGGATWGEVIEVTGVLDYVSPVALAQNSAGELHFLRIVNGDAPQFLKEYSLVVEDWQWDGVRWSNQSVRTIVIKGDRANFFVSGGLTSDGWLSALVSVEYLDLDGNLQSQNVGMSRQSELLNPSAEAFGAIISTPQLSVPQPTAAATEQTIDESPSQGEILPSRFKNLVGIALIVLVIGMGLYLARRKTMIRS